MKIKDFASVAGLRLEVNGTLDGHGKPYWTCRLADTEISEGAVLSNIWGRGRTHRQAINDYCQAIQGKTIIYRAYHEDRRVIKVPASLRG